MLLSIPVVPALGAAETGAGAVAWEKQLAHEAPLVIGHRGASGYRPEHTLASYELAIEMGADFIEPDLVSTKDGVLVARHENELGMTTDVAEKFPDRKTKKTIDGAEIEGWFSEDFTLAEIKTLRAKQSRAGRTTGWDGLYEIPTFVEVIQLAQRKSAEKGRVIGIYPETKHPSYFDSIGLSLEEPLVATLTQFGYTTKQSPVFLQSFETQNLKDLRGMTGVRLVQLFDEFHVRPYDFVAKNDPRTYRDLMTPAELANIARYADGIGPWKRTIVLEKDDGTLQSANSLIDDAHKAGLFVHAYTFRDEPETLAVDYGNDASREYEHFFALGLDGVFTDFPDTAVRARDRVMR
ncbi:MAG: glycerophosphodiester phosphodiesterase [Alphaproteobacteria bacterium]